MKSQIVEIVKDAKTGELYERVLELEIMTPEEAEENDSNEAIAEANAAIYAQLAANDAKIVRALAEGDQARIASHLDTQATLRSQIIRK